MHKYKVIKFLSYFLFYLYNVYNIYKWYCYTVSSMVITCANRWRC